VSIYVDRLACFVGRGAQVTAYPVGGKRKRVPIREEVRNALIALIAFEPDGIYAYELDRRLRVLSEGFWTPYSGEVSRTLHQLEEDGDISSRWKVDDGRPKRVFTAAPRGLRRVEEWLGAPITAEPRPLRDKLWHRFVAHRARRWDPAQMTRDIHIRRAASLEQLRRLEERLATIQGADPHAPFIRVSLRIQQLEWQAELGILDEIERELIQLARAGVADRADEPKRRGTGAGGKETAIG
jgi:DNA-binding PadR family transcriptional regulator